MEPDPEWEDRIKYGLGGMATGAMALAIIGFNWGGWVTGSTAEANAGKQAVAAVVAVLTPMCVEKFRAQPNGSAKLVELDKAEHSKKTSYVADGGWATFTGAGKPESGVAEACVALLLKK